ncbi:MAG: hypothetical protein DSZ12_02845 [Sulfurovum sp.]|nr:MAG: hypothetical protein DSZ12_02845 [Sulfurovum sp.]
MNDHNLDDLIIDNIDPKNSKTKSFLTIMALAIIILIIAIILTKIMLKDPNAKLALEKHNAGTINPDLTLQKQLPKDEPSKDTLSLHTEKKSPIQSHISAPKEDKKSATIKPETLGAKALSQDAVDAQKQAVEETKKMDKQYQDERKEKEQEIKSEKAKATTKEEPLDKVSEQKQKIDKKKTIEKKKQESPIQSNVYYIQVGSFNKAPSDRFLSVIKNAGFKYHITSIPNSKTKKLLIGPYQKRTEASKALARVKDRINKSAFIIKK